MAYLCSISCILGFTLLGEILHMLIPLPVPAAVYGIALLFGALCLKWVKPEQVKPAGNFLISVMPILFVAPTVNLLDSWQQAVDSLLPIVLILVVSTAAVFAVSGLVTRALLKRGEKSYV